MTRHYCKLTRPMVFSCLIIILFASYAQSEKMTLYEGLKLALKEENILKLKEQEETIAALEAKVVKSSYLPHLDVSYGKVFLNREPTTKNFFMGRPVEVPISERDFYTYSVTVRQLIFDFFGVWSSYQSKKIFEEIKRMETLKTKNTVALQFVRYYYDLKEQEKIAEVLQKEVEKLESHLNDAKALYDEGMITKNELLYTEVLLSDAKQRLINLKNLKSLTTSILNKMMGKEFHDKILFEEPKKEAVLIKSLEDYVSEAHEARPEIKIVQKAKDQLAHLKQAKKSELLPKFFLEGKYTFTENRYQVYEGITSVTLGMSMNLFDGGKTRNELKILDIEEKKINIEEKKIKDEIKLEVEKYFTDFLNAKERLKTMENAIKQAEENLRITQVKYREGVGTGTEVLDAIAALCLSESNYHRALYDMLRAEAGLIYATGRSFEEEYKP
ncbi:MAG: TolC family protein [Deltaproteobacteria bacterium]|nr:TolC family protein [Deltaproteobacteria bacterium]